MNSQISHFFTVDVEEYFQVKALESAVKRDEWLSQPSRLDRSIDLLLSLLDRHAAKATFFTLGWVADHRPSVVRSIADAGHEIASHGYWHERVTSLDAKSFSEDVRASKWSLEDLTGREVLGYRAPSFSIIPGWEWAFDVLIEEGYAYDSSLFPIHRAGYGYPGSQRTPHMIARGAGKIAEFPLATTSLFGYPVPAAGGGYLRQFPVAIIQRALREAAQRGTPSTFYIHPWEIDPGQPRLNVSLVNRVRHYRGLSDTMARLDRLLHEFRFCPIEAHLAQVWQSSSPPMAIGAA
ncbi:MAG TPA: XrtA system polysaccharide deacetylase [Gemmatimonadaceae bacterium]|nr:XrtA system polysaccharide deacetylase [Gemmatimonadaceae bacterium]